MPVAGGPVPDVESAGGSAHAQGGGVLGGTALSAQGRENGEGVETGGEAGEVDLVADGNAGQNAVTGRGLGGMGVDVDDHQAGRATGDTDAEFGMVAPPLLDTLLVEGGRVETVAPAASAQAGTVTRSVGVLAAVAAVPGRGLTPGSKRVHRPASAGAPLRCEQARASD